MLLSSEVPSPCTDSKDIRWLQTLTTEVSHNLTVQAADLQPDAEIRLLMSGFCPLKVGIVHTADARNVSDVDDR